MKKITFLPCIAFILSIVGCGNQEEVELSRTGKYYGGNEAGGNGIIEIRGNDMWSGTFLEDGVTSSLSGNIVHDDIDKLIGSGTMFVPGLGRQIVNNEIYGEFQGQDIVSGGWKFSKEKQYKKCNRKKVQYLQVFGTKVYITTTKSRNDVCSLMFHLNDNNTLTDASGKKRGKIYFSTNSARVFGIAGCRGRYKIGDYTYETGPFPNEKELSSNKHKYRYKFKLPRISPNRNNGTYNFNYGNKKTNTYDGLSDIEEIQRLHKSVEKETRQQTIDFLNKAYGYDVSSYVD